MNIVRPRSHWCHLCVYIRVDVIVDNCKSVGCKISLLFLPNVKHLMCPVSMHGVVAALMVLRAAHNLTFAATMLVSCPSLAIVQCLSNSPTENIISILASCQYCHKPMRVN